MHIILGIVVLALAFSAGVICGREGREGRNLRYGGYGMMQGYGNWPAGAPNYQGRGMMRIINSNTSTTVETTGQAPDGKQ